MKKAFSFILIFVMLMSFCSCSNSKQADKITRGKTENNIYTNSCLNIRFSPAENWVYLNDEEIASVYSTAVENYFSEETGEILETADVIYDCYAYNTETGASCNVIFENLGVLYGEIFDEVTYLEVEKENLMAQLSESTVKVTKAEITETVIDKEKFNSLLLDLDMTEENGFAIKEIILVRRVGDYMGVITLSALTENELNEICDMMRL